ncbi:ribonuclease H-like domain-containing protein [Tanacetum coccineum]
MHDPREPHLAALKHILRYVEDKLDFGLQLYDSSSTSLGAYFDVDWVGCATTRRSTSRYCVFLGDNLLPCELHSPLHYVILVYCDNVIVIHLTVNPVRNLLTKHIEIDIHFVFDMVARGQIRVLHVASRYQYVNIFTKGLLLPLFEKFRTSLSVRAPPAPTAREC